MQQLKNTPITSLPALAQQIRNRIIEVIATRGGHLGASLGVVELTIALHYVFDTPHDILVWDVGHQSYAHKILTGRKSVRCFWYGTLIYLSFCCLGYGNGIGFGRR